MMSKLLSHLSLLDRNGNLSITNIALVALVARAVIVPGAGIADALLTAAAFINYMQRRYETSKHEAQSVAAIKSDLEQQVSELASDVAKLSSALVVQRRGQS